MVLDPLTALSVAGTIVQFVDFSSKVLLKSHELFTSETGASSVDEQLSFVTNELLKLTTKLSRPLRLESVPMRSTSGEHELEVLCNECGLVARELLARLDGLKVKGGSFRKLKSFQKAIKSAWTKEEVKAIATRLSGFKDMIQMHILANIRTNIESTSVQTSQRFDRLDKGTQQIITALAKGGNILPHVPSDQAAVPLESLTRLDSQLLALSQLLNRTEVVLMDERNQPSIVDAMAQRRTYHNRYPNEQLIRSTQSDEARLRLKAEEAVLDTFRFSIMGDRHEGVAEAHRKTFQWMFTKSRDNTRMRDNFVDWLRSDGGIYWINGKAGSGKSTLMKFIYGNPNTMRLLSAWSPSASKAGFFFWSSGSKEQRSHTGLLRSLIVEILRQHRTLIPIMFPSQWAQNYSQAVNNTNYFAEKIWSYVELLEIFQRVIDQDTVPVKLCLFIDGLDEYDDNKRKIADFVIKLSHSPKIKLCVSSRPLLEFGDAFSSYPSLRLQDLTLGDIQDYVSDHLATNPRYKQLTYQEPLKAPALVQEIVHKADGVFLWVKLVVQSLLDGFGNRDTIADLNRRLSLLPLDLEDLYSHMLSCIPEFYMGHASRLFQILRAVQELEKQTVVRKLEPLTTLGLSFALEEDESLAITAEIDLMPKAEIEIRCQLTEDRLKAQSVGLLEVQMFDAVRSGLGGIHSAVMRKANGKVQYLHRTVHDYLSREDIWERQLEATRGSGFQPHVAIMRSYLLHLKRINTSGEDQMRRAYMILEHAYYAETTTGHSDVGLLDELERTMSLWSRIGPDRWTDSQSTPNNTNFLTIALSYGLCAYMRTKLSTGSFSNSNGSNDLGRLLDYALNSSSIDVRMPCSHQMVELLLQYGCHPNKKYGKCTIWENALFSTTTLMRDPNAYKQTVEMLERRLRILELLVQYGADPDVVEDLQERNSGRTAIGAIKEEFGTVLPRETERLVGILVEKSTRKRREQRRKFGLMIWMKG